MPAYKLKNEDITRDELASVLTDLVESQLEVEFNKKNADNETKLKNEFNKLKKIIDKYIKQRKTELVNDYKQIEAVLKKCKHITDSDLSEYGINKISPSNIEIIYDDEFDIDNRDYRCKNSDWSISISHPLNSEEISIFELDKYFKLTANEKKQLKNYFKLEHEVYFAFQEDTLYYENLNINAYVKKYLIKMYFKTKNESFDLDKLAADIIKTINK